MIQVGQQQVNGGARLREILAEPMTIHYAAVNKHGTGHEVGETLRRESPTQVNNFAVREARPKKRAGKQSLAVDQAKSCGEVNRSESN